MINHKPTELTPKLWIEFVVFMAAYYPLFVILLVRDIGKTSDRVTIGLGEWGYQVSCWAITLFFISSVATVFSAVLMRENLTYQEGGVAIIVKKCRLLRGDMLNYTLPFLMGLFAFDYSSWQSITALLLFLLFMFSFVIKDRVNLLNPMFLLMDIRLYEMEYNEVGNTRDRSKTVLCLGELKASGTTIYIKDSAGIQFIYPQKVAKGNKHD